MQAAPILSQHSSVYQTVTDQIIKQLEAGVAPWHKPWSANPPQNLSTRRPYRGINVFLLASCGYGSPYWLTYKQAVDHGGHVRKGQHGTKVVFWKIGKREVEDADGSTTERKSVLMRQNTVFNIEQCDGIAAPEVKTAINPIEACEQILQAMPNPPTIEQDGRAWYRPCTDTIGIPAPSAFNWAEQYYSALFHELTHSTGHSKRIGRDGIEKLNTFGSESYSKEELIAEMGAAMLCGIAGIEHKTLPNSAAYLHTWIEVLKDDSRMLVSAASQAQKAADYILGKEGYQWQIQKAA